MRLLAASAFALVAAACTLAVSSHGGPANADAPTPTSAGVARAEKPFPTIEVGASSELAIAPDEAWVHLGVESFFAKVPDAVADNDKRIAAILVTLKKAGIDAADMSTTTMALAETDRYDEAQRRLHGWQVSRSLVARVRKLDTLESLLQALVQAGATHLRDVQFSHSQLAAKKADARVAAMKAARDKASLMASALGQGIGRAVTIRESDAGSRASTFSDYTNAVVNAGGVPLEGQTIAAGRIRVDVGVLVTFELM